MLQFKLETFTPARAQMELDKATAAGFAQQARVAMYKGAMLRGSWEANTGEALKFARINGHGWINIDGQHRLSAIVESGVSMDLWVVYGVSPNAFIHLDQGAARDVTDILTTKGWGKNAAVCSTAGRMLWKEDSTGTPFEKPEGEDALSEGEIAESIEANYRPALLDLVGNNKPALMAAQRRGVGGVGWLAYVGLRLEEVAPGTFAPILAHLADPTVAPPHPAWTWATEHVRAVRAIFEGESSAGRVLMGRNRDLCDETVRAYRAAWEFQRSGRRCTSMTPIKAAIKASTNNGWQPFA
jgi:hypothetical protein